MKLCTTTGDFSLHCDNEFDKIKEMTAEAVALVKEIRG